ncbi:universal stress protein [Mycolicibacterium parafortuitum]|uniref:Stress protein [Rhodococcus jostii RHA1] n=1 Tax=Mycolicibacterium parafortuitum TaxID=39692 RepID=A0A375YNK7_MYCPF|nr:universal stress protein [Mycolicibacterium parafortuitum]ORB29169.1 universal stress protein UspA [Mycolicibacterium parafortuitum]SRX82700.1 stress protein [Rhodococcus jostii RHA1] [Mycolicibacterium parafortuitum]
MSGTTIVVGYTADPFGHAALEHGISEARLRGAGLLVVNATSGESYVDARFAGATEVQDVETRLADCGVAYELRQPIGVDPADELLAAVDSSGAELLVVGIRHRNPVGKLLLGSVAQKVILECPKPVLAVKPAAD